MNREGIGHVAASIIRAVTRLARIDVQDRQKTILITEACSATDWASLTFIGQHHRLALRLEGEVAAVTMALAMIETGIAEAEIPLAGHFVAEARVAETSPPVPAEHGGIALRICIEVLVLRD